MSAQVAQTLLNRGLSKPSLFQFQIPRGVFNNQFGANEYLEYFCKTVSLPEITHDVMLMNGHERQGVVSSQAYGVKYAKPLTITVIERSDFHTYQNFKEWFSKTAVNSYSTSGSQKMNYRANSTLGSYGYRCDLQLIKYEQPTFKKNALNQGRGPRNLQGNSKNLSREGFRKVWNATFVNSYITSIGDMQFSTEARDTMLEYQVQFYYDTYDVKFYTENGDQTYQRT